MGLPKIVFKHGQIECAIFENEREDYKTYSFKFQKNYKDKEGKYQNTDFFNQDDLGKLIIMIAKVSGEYCVKEKTIKAKNDNPAEDFYSKEF